MSFDSSKAIAGVGAILIALGELFSPFLTLIGAILLLIGVNELANYYKHRGIFNNFLIGFIIAFIGIFVVVVMFLSGLYQLSRSATTTAYTYIGPGYSYSSSQSYIDPQAFFRLIITVAYVGAFFSLVQTIFFIRSLYTLRVKSGDRLFSISGLILLAAVVLVFISIGIILLYGSQVNIGTSYQSFFVALSLFSSIGIGGLIGTIVYAIGWILVCIAFFSLKPRETSQAQQVQTTQN